MDTLVLTTDADTPDPATIRRAADVLRGGGLVAFPTETVYGLGGNALSAGAAGRIFEAKGRPPTNPLIVHIADVHEVLNVAAEWPETAAKLAGKFWPGPLTLVLPKNRAVPDAVTAGGPTVAVRWPAHRVAQALIRAAGVPVAAPSANRSTELSPTRAEHVLKSLNGRIDVLLDGGTCTGGIESTVVDVTGDVPRVLRPGLVTVPMLEAVVGRVEAGAEADGVARSPGQMLKHYSPKTPLKVCEWDDQEASKEANRRYRYYVYVRFQGEGGLRAHGYPADGVVVRMMTLPENPERAAAKLYDFLHDLDRGGWEFLLIELPPDTPEWAGVRDRLTRAAAK